MDEDNIDAEILFPAVSGNRGIDAEKTPREAAVGVVRGYNDWLSQEFCAVDPDRLLGVALIPQTNVDDATAELYRLAEMPGIRTAVLHQWPNGGPTPKPEEDMKFWQAAAETGLPLSVHIRMGGGAVADVPANAPKGNWSPINKLLTRVDASGATYVATQMIASRIFDRFPDLQIGFAETGASWVPFYIESADSNYTRHRWQAGFELDHEPSHYIKRNFLWGIQDDFASIRIRHEIGVDKILWATDFPHAACDWPESMDLVERMFDGVPADEKYAICAGNAVRFYRLNGS
jgi:predicted TIM-barrel fold metal-dependent hydrolase